MTIEKKANGNELIMVLTGRLDTITAPLLEKELQENLDGVESLILDFAALDYLSSAGLRVLLSIHKIMSARGGMVVRNANEAIMEIFDVTGFCDVLNIE